MGEHQDIGLNLAPNALEQCPTAQGPSNGVGAGATRNVVGTLGGPGQRQRPVVRHGNETVGRCWGGTGWWN
jgi:hypothetical protein